MGALLEKEGFRSLAVIPVKDGDRVIASLILSSRSLDEIPLATRLMLEAAGAQTGGIIRKIEADAALKRSEERYRDLFENAPVGIMRGTCEGKPLDCNLFLARMHGYESPVEFLSAVPDLRGGLVNPEDHYRLVDIISKKKTLHSFETEVRHKDGQKIILSISVRGIWGDTGTLEAMEGFLEDITVRKQAEEAVRLHLSVMETVAEGIFLIGSDDYRIKWTNTRLEEMFGYDPGEMIGMHVDNINAPAEKTPAETRIFVVDQLLQAKEWQGEIQNIKKDGTTFWCHAHVSPFDHPQFGLVFVAAHTDIDERKQLEEELHQANDGLEARVQERTQELSKAFQTLTAEIRNRKTAEDALRESEIKYRSIVDAFDGYIILYSPDYRIEFMNRKFISTLGYDATGKLCYEVLHNRDSICPWCNSDRVFRGETVRFEMHSPETDRYYHVVATPVRRNDGAIWKQSILIDITDRKLAEMNLKARETELAEKSVELEETNTALRILLKRREEDKTELEENIMYNAQQMLTPYIEKLKSTHLDNRQKLFIDILESNINEIISPFARNLFWKFSNLTAMELQVAALVQQGRRIKEIADILKIAEDTVKFHRLNLRKKCGLKERKSNLKAFLQSLTKV
jgi:PAS domain S-box-containing protein